MVVERRRCSDRTQSEDQIASCQGQVEPSPLDPATTFRPVQPTPPCKVKKRKRRSIDGPQSDVLILVAVSLSRSTITLVLSSSPFSFVEVAHRSKPNVFPAPAKRGRRDLRRQQAAASRAGVSINKPDAPLLARSGAPAKGRRRKKVVARYA